MSEDTPMDDDALLEGWDAYVSGRANGLDRLNSQDREVIEMLHARAWSPLPRQSFTSDLQTRLTTGSTGDQVVAPVVPRPTHQPPVPIGRPAPWRMWQRTALAAMLIAALIASFGGRLGDDPSPPTVQAPLAASIVATYASPVAGDSPCLDPEIGLSRVGEAYVDPMMTEVLAALPSVRYATLQTLTRREAGSVIPDGYDLSGVSGIVVDIVVVGAAEATFREGAWATTVESMRFTGTSPVTPNYALDLVRGDTVVYPVGALVDMSNALNGRPLEVVRLVLHDIEELPGRATNSITLETVGRAAVEVDTLTNSSLGFSVWFGYAVGLSSPEVPGAACRPLSGTLVSGIADEDPIVGAPGEPARYGGPYGWLAPFVVAPPATPTT